MQASVASVRICPETLKCQRTFGLHFPLTERWRCHTLIATATTATIISITKSRIKKRAFENELGVQAPLGLWDPMGFTDDGDMASYRRRRSVEFKHGRIAMLATMGFMTPEIIGHWPGYLSPSMSLKFADVPNGLAALNVVPTLGQAGFEDGKGCQGVMCDAFCLYLAEPKP